MTKFVFVTGGVVSSLGKGIASASPQIKERLSKVKPVERNLKGWLKQYQKLATSADKGAILK